MTEPPANPADALKRGHSALKGIPKWAWVAVVAGGALVIFLAMRRNNADANAVADSSSAVDSIPQQQPYSADLYSGQGDPYYQSPPISYSGNLFGPSNPNPISDSQLPAAAATPPGPVVTVAPIINLPPPIGAQPGQAPTVAPPTGGGPPARPAPGSAHGTVPAGQPSSNDLQSQIRAYNKEASSNATHEARLKELAAAYNFVASALKSRGATIPAPDGKLAKYGARKP